MAKCFKRIRALSVDSTRRFSAFRTSVAGFEYEARAGVMVSSKASSKTISTITAPPLISASELEMEPSQMDVTTCNDFDCEAI